MTPITLTESEREQIATILMFRANEVVKFVCDNKGIPLSAEHGLDREIDRLRALATKVNPPKPEEEEE